MKTNQEPQKTNLPTAASRPRSTRRKKRPQERRASVKYQLYSVFTTVYLHDTEVVTLLDTGWRCIRLLNLTVNLYSPSFLSFSVFIFVFVFVFPHVFVIIFVFSIFTMISMIFSQSFLLHPRIPPRSIASDVQITLRGKVL